MSYEVVARRWRPSTFDSVVGQRHVTATLKNAIERDRVAHAFLFTGIRGVGKTTVARVLARALNCQNRSGPEPCNECSSCTQILDGASVDVLEIDGASNRGIDEVRSLIDAAGYRPAMGPYRVYIIDEVHQLTKEAFNALLKILEEPPDHVKFVMATTEAHKVLPTVLSRCQRYDFRRLTLEEIRGQLQAIVKADALDVDDDALALIAREGEGSMRDAQSLLEQLVAAVEGRVTAEEATALLGLAGLAQVERCVTAILEGDAAAVVGITHELARTGFDEERFLNDVLDLVRHVSIARAAGADSVSDAYGEAVKETAARLAEKRSALDLQRIFHSLLGTASDLRRGVDPELVLEMGLLKAASFESVETVGALIAELRGMSEGSPAGGAGGGSRGEGERSPRPPAPKKSPTSAQPPASPRGASGDASAPVESAPPAELPAGKASLGEQDEDRWEGFLARVREKCGLDLYVTLSNCEVVVWTDEVLELRPALGSFRRKLDSDAVMRRIGEVAKLVLGESVTVRVQGESAVAGDAPVPDKTISVQKIENDRTDRLEREALEDPVVRSAIDVLGGKVEKITRVDE